MDKIDELKKRLQVASERGESWTRIWPDDVELLVFYRDIKRAESERDRAALAAARAEAAALGERLARAEADNATLRAKLSDAADDIASWADYASDYMRDKHKLAETLAEYRALAARPDVLPDPSADPRGGTDQRGEGAGHA